MKFNYDDNFLYFYSILLRSYKEFSANGLKEFDLSPIEIEILKFLINNGKYFKTAKDIVTYKGVSKALVSKGVNDLIESGYLVSEVSKEDKRISNLFITAKADPIVEKLKKINEDFSKSIFENIPMEDIDGLKATQKKMLHNLQKIKLY